MTLITDTDLKALALIKKLIDADDETDDSHLDYQNIELEEAFNRISHNLKHGHNYFKILPDSEKKWFNAKCESCGWFGSSEYLLGGGQIADTGDYDDTYCPICQS